MTIGIDRAVQAFRALGACTNGADAPATPEGAKQAGRSGVRGILEGMFFAAVFLAPACFQAQTPTFTEKVSAGNSTLRVSGKAGDTLNLYAYDVGFSVTACGSADDFGRRKSLSFNTSSPAASGAAAPASATAAASTITSTDATLPGSSGTVSGTFNLTQPLVAGTTLCIVDTTPDTPVWSKPLLVEDPYDFGRYRMYFIAGIQANNQLSASTNSSATAGEYLELGFINSWLRARDKMDECYLKSAAPESPATDTCKTGQGSRKHFLTPGITTVLDMRLSPISVGASATSTSTGSSGAAPAATPSTTPNSLSSQQAVRVVGAIYAPWKLTYWNAHNDFFTLGPLVRGGFGTLVNPSSSATTSAGSSATGSTVASITTTSFNSAYYAWSVGGRLGWDRYSSNTEKAPQSMAQLLATFGEFSNLPSYVCKPTPAGVTSNVTANTLTACGIGPFAPTLVNGVSTYAYSYSRTLVPRLDLEGYVHVPGTPFVLGAEANLQQYTLSRRPNLDYMNKPGNDVRVYVGVLIDLATVLSHAGFNMP